MALHRLAHVGIVLIALILGIAPLTAFAQDSLSEQYVSSSGSLKFSYPAGWIVVEDQGMIVLTNDEAALEEDTVPSGVVGVVVMEPATIGMMVYDLTDTSPEGVVTAVAESISFGELDVIPVPESITAGDRPAARASLGLDVGDVLVIAVDAGDGNTLALVAIAAAGEMGQFETYILGVAATVEYTPAWRATLYGHEDWVNDVAFSPDGAQVASASDDGTVRVWDVSAGQEVSALRVDYGATLLTFSTDGRVLFATDGDRIRLWGVTGGPDEPQTCTFSAAQIINLRAGPGIEYARLGNLTPGDGAEVDGQALGSDGLTWYHLTAGAWVRADLTGAPDTCLDVPIVTP